MGDSLGLFGRLNPINAKVSVQLDRSTFAEREPVTGRVIVNSDEDVHADEIRLEIRITETGYSYGGPTVSVGGLTIAGRSRPPERQVIQRHAENIVLSGALDLYKGYSGEFPFSVSIPPIAPTMSSGAIARKIKGVIAAKGRPDKTQEANVNISVAPYTPVAQVPGQVVVKEVVKVPCKYCGALIPVEAQRCSNCGAKLGR